MKEITFRLEKAREFLDLILKFAREENRQYVVRESLSAMNRKKRQTLKKYLEIFEELGIVKRSDRGYIIDACSAFKAWIFLKYKNEKLEEIACTSKIMSEILKFLNNKNLDLSLLDLLFLVGYDLKRQMKNLVLRKLKGLQVPKDLVDTEIRAEKIIRSICNLYAGQLAFPETIIQEPFDSKAIIRDIYSFLNKTKLDLAQPDLHNLSKQREVKLTEGEVLMADRYLFLLVLKEYKKLDSKQLEEEPECIKEIIDTIHDSLVGLILVIISMLWKYR